MKLALVFHSKDTKGVRSSGDSERECSMYSIGVRVHLVKRINKEAFVPQDILNLIRKTTVASIVLNFHTFSPSECTFRAVSS
jgi:hypothetical protein